MPHPFLAQKTFVILKKRWPKKKPFLARRAGYHTVFQKSFGEQWPIDPLLPIPSTLEKSLSLQKPNMPIAAYGGALSRTNTEDGSLKALVRT